MPLSSTLVGRTLGGFLIQGQLGSGGMGVVYRAHDERLNRTVAVKVLHPKFTADTELRERFVREGRTAALIDHPNVVRVISAGEEDGIPYLVMEYVEGGTLDRMLERPECLSVARCLRIAKQLAEALASAHRVGVMHRDVKPANVLFTNAGEPKLADFGLAREEAGDHNLSQTGILLGTPHYMSPEACEGRHGDARSDIYSLGVLLYAMLEKRLPFQGDSQAGILIAQIQAPVPPLTQAPAALKQVVYKALEKKAADRWASASEFAAALERVLEEIYLPPSQWTGGATPVRGNGASRHSSGPTEAIHPAAKADGLAATVFRGKRSSRRRRLIGASTVAVLLVAGVFLAPSFRRRGNVSTPSTAGELAAMPPVSSSTDIVPDPPVSAVTNLTIGPPDFVAGGPDDSDEEFKRVSQKAETLESFGEFLAAMAAWTEFQPTSRKAQFALELARKELRERSAARVKRELALKPRGAKAAADLRILATRFPEPESLRLLAAAAEADKGWTAADGLDGLRYGFVHHDCASLLAEIDAAGTGVSADDKSRIESARNSVRRLGLMLDRSFAWYRSHRGTVIDAQRTDGPAVHGTIQTVDEAARLVYIETPGTLVNLSAAELSTAELVGRALQDNPPDEVLLAALDLLILAGDSAEAWPVALRVRRRGLCIEPDREELLAGQIPAESTSAAKAALLELESLRGDAVRLRAASRDWLRKYRALPLDPVDVESARDALRQGGGIASAEDVELCCAARVSGRGKTISLDYGAPEALLGDFDSSGAFAVVPGELAAIRPAPIPKVQLLKGLVWKEGVIEMQLRTASTFSVLVGWRGPAERFEFVVSPARDGRIAISLPIKEMSFEAAALAEGWIDLRFAWAAGKIVVRVNGTTRECPLPRDWSGAIGFAPGGSWSWRSLQVYGQADFEPPAKAGAFEGVPQVKRDLKSSWGTWVSPRSTKNEISLGSGEEVEWAAPANWEAGNDYRVVFGMRLLPGATVMFDIGVGDGHRRVSLGAEGGSGFVLGGSLFRSGLAAADPGAREVSVEIFVYGGSARILMEGSEVWRGQVPASNRGGLTVGSSGGRVIFSDLKVSVLEP